MPCTAFQYSGHDFDLRYWSHIGKNSPAISDIVYSGMTGFCNVTYKF
jgi:hypothetical protein